MSGEGDESRGDPEARMPATANEDAGGGETRSPIKKAEGDDDPMSCKDIRKAPGTQVSGAFDFGRKFSTKWALLSPV